MALQYVSFLSDLSVVVDVTNLVHYKSYASALSRAACGVVAIRDVVPMRPVTCFECLAMEARVGG